MDDDQRRARARAQRRQRVLEQVRADLGVEAGERLVEHQHVGTDRDRAGEVDPPTLATRQRRGPALRQVVGADRAERLAGALGPLGSRHAPPRQREHHVCEHGPAGQVGRLQGDPDPAVALDPTFRRGQRASERIEQRALAGAVGSEQRDDLAGAKLRADVVDDLALAAPDASGARSAAAPPGRGVIRTAHAADRKRRRIPLPWCWSMPRPPIRIRISAISTIAIATASA